MNDIGKGRSDSVSRGMFQEKYLSVAHGIQSALAWILQRDPSSGSPKHLRVGLNLRAVEHGALVDLLIKKGVITDSEYRDAMIAGMEREYEKLEAEANEYLPPGSQTKLTFR